MAVRTKRQVSGNRATVILISLMSLLIGYGLASRAIDTGSLWLYALSIAALTSGIVGAFKVIKSLVITNVKTGRSRRA